MPESVPTTSVRISASQLEVARGQVELVLANVTRGGGYDGDVALVVDKAPDGIRAQVSGYITANGVTSAYIAVFVDPAVDVGIYEVAVRAIAFGLPDISVPFSIVVEPSGTPAYTLEIRPIAIARGTSAVISTYIDRGSNSRDIPVVLTVDTLPAGVTVSLYPVSNAKSLTNMTVNVGADAAPGLRWLTIRGRTTSLNDRTATIPLQVLPN